MSFWIHAYCNESVASVTPQELTTGIAERLSLLTYLFCPDNEEDPDAVLARLKIDSISSNVIFGAFRMSYRANSPRFISIDRIDDARGKIVELEQNVLSRRPVAEVAEIRQILANATEDVVFCLKADDVEAMGFPLTIAAASYLVERGGGLIQSGTYSWMVPVGKEVRIIAEFNA